MFFFFFSSRRRHTRYWRDWSSDVCSSDLFSAARTCSTYHSCTIRGKRLSGASAAGKRSEERRVGKECRYRWWPYPSKKTRMSSVEPSVSSTAPLTSTLCFVRSTDSWKFREIIQAATRVFFFKQKTAYEILA